MSKKISSEQSSEQSSKFVSFITAGDPSLAKTREFIGVLKKYSDIIEIGLPFSDPIAEGEVIQAANMRSLKNGTTTDKVFDMLATVEFDKLALLAYINNIFAYGVEKFFKKCKECGIYGVIIPDLPYEERGEVDAFAKKYGIHLITIIAPTSEQRIRMLAKDASGFIYLVSSLGVTGTRSEFNAGLKEIVRKIKEVTDVPVMIGFGISTPDAANEMRKAADGIIVGSAIVKIIAEHGDNAAPHIEKFIKEML